jgi:hypothetical protein
MRLKFYALWHFRQAAKNLAAKISQNFGKKKKVAASYSITFGTVK